MEFKFTATVDIDDPTPENLRIIRSRIRNLLLDFGSEINVTVDFAVTEVWSGSGLLHEKDST